MAKQKGSKQPRGKNSPSRQRSIAMGLTARHSAVRAKKVHRRLMRLAETYTRIDGVDISPRKLRRRAEKETKRREVIASFKPGSNKSIPPFIAAMMKPKD